MFPCFRRHFFGTKSIFLPLLLLGNLLLVCLSPAISLGQQGQNLKRILVLDWYTKDHPWNVRFDQSFQSTLKSSSSLVVEYYSEYLENNRFPGEKQSLIFRDYLREKYADRKPDVIVANSDTVLSFLLKYRDSLFSKTPIVFIAAQQPSPDELTAGPGITGIINIYTYNETLDVALALHPNTQQVFVISGNVERDKKFEMLARKDLEAYEGKLEIVYLTDLQPEELRAKLKTVPERSIVFYVWQQTLTKDNKQLETEDVFAVVAESARVPIYTLSPPYVTEGAIGGNITTAETIANRAALMALRIANGEQAQNIPLETAPIVPTFDWRQLKRWGISENQLPPGSTIQFKEFTFWQLYRWRIVGVAALVVIQTLLIAGLLIQRSRRAKAEEFRRVSEEKFSKAFRSSPDALVISRQSDGQILEANDRWQDLFGYDQSEAIGRTALDLNLYVNPEDRAEVLKRLAAEGYVHEFEVKFRNKSNEIRTGMISVDSIIVKGETFLIAIIRDVTDLKNSENALRESEERNRLVVQTAMDAVITMNPQGYITGWNKQAAFIFGWSAEETIGRLLSETIVPSQHREAHTRGLERFRKTGEGRVLNKRIEITGLRRDGTEFPVELTISRASVTGEVMFIGFLRDITERKRSVQALQKMTEQLIQLRDDEHRRIAAELHDGLGQSLSIIRNRATLCKEDISDRESVLEQLDEISATAVSAIDEVREIAHNLRPYELDRLGLVAAVRSMVTKVSSVTSIRLLPDLDDIDGLLSPAAETSIYRIVQEGLNNAIKHAEASEVRVVIKRQDSDIVLSVQDDGKGIAPVSESGDGKGGNGFGLHGIAERTRILGGIYSIDSKPGQGTILTVRLHQGEQRNGR